MEIFLFPLAIIALGIIVAMLLLFLFFCIAINNVGKEQKELEEKYN